MKNNIINTKEFAEKLIGEFNEYQATCIDNGIIPRLDLYAILDYFSRENEKGIFELDQIKLEKLDKNSLATDMMFLFYEQELKEMEIAGKEDVHCRAHYNLVDMYSANPRQISKSQSNKECIEIYHALAENDDFCELEAVEEVRAQLKKINLDAYNFYHVIGYETAKDVLFDIRSMKELCRDYFKLK